MLLVSGILFFFFWPRLVAYKISAPQPGLNLGHGSENLES